MAGYGEQIRIPGLTAGEDLSSGQYKVVKFASTANQVLAASATTDIQIGVLQNDPASGQEASVCGQGVSLVLASSANISAGQALTANTTGQVDSTTTDNIRIIGYALEDAGAAGDLFKALIQPSHFG